MFCNFDLTTQKNLCKNIHFSTEDCWMMMNWWNVLYSLSHANHERNIDLHGKFQQCKKEYVKYFKLTSTHLSIQLYIFLVQRSQVGKQKSIFHGILPNKMNKQNWKSYLLSPKIFLFYQACSETEYVYIFCTIYMNVYVLMHFLKICYDLAASFKKFWW